jgi:hypothetical protein
MSRSRTPGCSDVGCSEYDQRESDSDTKYEMRCSRHGESEQAQSDQYDAADRGIIDVCRQRCPAVAVTVRTGGHGLLLLYSRMINGGRCCDRTHESTLPYLNYPVDDVCVIDRFRFDADSIELDRSL